MPESTAPRGSEIQYRLLFEISQQISRTIDLQETLAHLLRLLRSILDYDAAGIFVLNRNVAFGPGSGSNMIAGMATVGFEHIAEGTDPMLRSGKGIVGHVIRTGETVIAPDVSRDLHYIEGRRQTQSEIAVPIVTNAQVIGALNVESDRLDAFTPEDGELLEAFAVAAAISIEKAVLHRQVVEKHLIEQQLKIAREVQASLLPAAPPAVQGYDIAGLNLPAWDIGGDYFDYFPLADGRLGLVIADVSGKGVPAALLMATFRAALRSEVRKNRPIPAIISDVRGTLIESMDTSRFVSAVFGVLDPGPGTFTYVNCGHNPPMLLHARGESELLAAGGPALGMFDGERAAPGTVHLDPGDTLLLYTDGVVESTDASLAEFGEARLARVLSDYAARPAGEIIGALLEATRSYAGRERYDDDFTLVVVKRRAA
ncbi:MAG TPA: GAF domain-containing SpoIIE family protein phosphatase [Vicinamibacterales bacterium]|nr:GAF domain-containing SpoIIE family protein phosphatase [Vicinamibacterales bacterium]